jgi:hypothetical protein
LRPIGDQIEESDRFGLAGNGWADQEKPERLLVNEGLGDRCGDRADDERLFAVLEVESSTTPSARRLDLSGLNIAETPVRTPSRTSCRALSPAASG